ncbi:CGI121 family protein [Histoplasma capsulatum]|uniref:EKC/KEOPS complex subunit CGI121 n=1 Tax=Ajellomyces capsulatus TaxID=5037 RepID=A0A8A1M800_AJECA|nr:CGI121 family protein [Histoplasma capsulatum]
MPSIQTIQLSHLPSNRPVHIALYRDLQNASFLREQLLAGNTEFEYASIDAATILSTTHLLAAVFRALNDHQNNRLKSKNVHSEIVYSLGANNNIAESFRKFGLTDATKDLIVVKVSMPPGVTNESVAQHLGEVVKGIPLTFDDDNLRLVSDIGRIKKAYKLGSGITKPAPRAEPGKAGQNYSHKPVEMEMRDLERTILGLMALRGS